MGGKRSPSPVRSAAGRAFDPAGAAAHPAYTATGLPPGITLGMDGTFTGAATAKGS